MSGRWDDRGGGRDRGGFNDRRDDRRGGGYNDRDGDRRGGGGGRPGSARPREVGGYVAAIKESFGFIEPVNAADLPAQLYFNFGAVLRRDELRVGDEVHFEVDSGRDGRSSAVRVQLLKPGTLPPPPRAKGVVERAPNRQGFGGRISYAASEGAAPESVSFEGRDVRERDPLDAGDLVEFVLAADHRGGGKCARQVKVLERGGGLPRERGVVVSMKDDRQFGFIRAEEGGAAQVRNSGAILCTILRNSAQFCANSLERCIHPPAALLPLPAAAAAGRRRRPRRHRGLVHPFFRSAHEEGASESPRGAAARHRRLRANRHRSGRRDRHARAAAALAP